MTMRKAMIAAGFSVMLACAAPAMAQQQTMAQQSAAALQKVVGAEYEGDLQVTAITAEGNVLVVTVNARSGWSNMTPKQIGEAFIGGFCKSPNAPAFFKSGGSVRVDGLDHGAGLQKGEPMNTCPTQ
jgi:F0F1-type ATP synthase membrane subunit c/vacuolar-type H+-ATPase subunit K